jgi:hypothetical protein
MEVTIGTVVTDLQTVGADRGALVMPAQPGAKEAGILVILRSSQAIAQVGMVLLPVISELGSAEHELSFNVDTRIVDFFRFLETTPHWAWAEPAPLLVLFGIPSSARSAALRI